MDITETSVFVTGHSKPVKDDAIYTIYQVFALSLVIETGNDCILNIACTTVMKESEEFLRTILCGKNIITDMEVMLQQIRTRFFTLAQKPVMVALKDAHNRYLTAFPEKQGK